MAEEQLARFNALPPGEAEAELLACCAAPSWAAAVAAGRPYATIASVLAASDDAFVRMPAADLSAAVAAHPRIGDRATSDTAGPGHRRRTQPDEGNSHAFPPGHEGRDEDTRDGEWSRQEQAGVAGASVDTMAALAVGNKAYEERFGQVFLICATGLSAAEMLAALRTRVGNDPDTEAKIVREELRKITGLRLRKLLGGDGT
jgi:2-oxo-4-hydroxy-4-carboxy-5-ureidoimidazoline decarboxylase